MSKELVREKVYEEPSARAVAVKLALERDGIKCIIVDTRQAPCAAYRARSASSRKT